MFQETQAEVTRLLMTLPENPATSFLPHSIDEGKRLK